MVWKIGFAPILAAVALAAAGCAEKAADPAPGYTQTAPSSPAPGRGPAPTGAACAGIIGIQCAAAADFCKLPQGQCTFPDAGGTCTTKPQVCTRDYRPVCGCDGKTYGNPCAADAAGVSVQAQGECPAPKA